MTIFEPELNQLDSIPLKTDSTFSEALDMYVEYRELMPTTRNTYAASVGFYYESWLSLPLSEITDEMVSARRHQLAKSNPNTHTWQAIRVIDSIRRWSTRVLEAKTREVMVFQTVVCAEDVTLRRAWLDYKNSRKLRAATLSNYERMIVGHLKDWLDLPLKKITKDMVEMKHRELTVRGEAVANDVFRRLRSVWRYAQAKYENEEGEPLVKNNPISRLSDIRAWHKIQVRRSVIPVRKLASWYEGLLSLENTMLHDIFMLLLTTGMRSGEAMNLRWHDVDLDEGTIILRQTKNGSDHLVALSDYTWTLLRRRRLAVKSPYVFPHRNNPDTAGITNLKPAAARISAYSNVPFKPHDTRRTFCTIADDLEIKAEVVKALVNHSSEDVTEGYTVRSPERLRRASQKITDAILQHIGIRSRPRPIATTLQSKV